MRYTKIAVAKPFEGKVKINAPSVFGASPAKPIIFRIPVTGERPVTYGAEGLPAGLALKDNIITGAVEKEGDYEITLTAENRLGRDEKKVKLEIHPQNVLVTPLMGFTTWNAFDAEMTQEDMIRVGHLLRDTGIVEYGYDYVNTDSGWQLAYGGEFDAIMPNKKFPDMKKMTDELHAMGYKCGIYSTPMLNAWGCPKDMESIPGCTQGEPDIRFYSQNGGIGVIRKERNNALQWDAWGFDYLKYDWLPADPVNAELMRSELVKLSRDFGFCVTVHALIEYREYWSRFCTSYRNNTDSRGNWDNLMRIYETYLKHYPYVCKGHYFDLDMLDTGHCKEDMPKLYTEDEQIVSYSMRAFFNSPIQLSCLLEKIDEFELSLYCNEEIIAINQDAAFNTSVPVLLEEKDGGRIHVYEKLLEDGSYAYAVFNMGTKESDVVFMFEDTGVIRDVWAKEDIATADAFAHYAMPHTVRIIKTAHKATHIAAKMM